MTSILKKKQQQELVTRPQRIALRISRLKMNTKRLTRQYDWAKAKDKQHHYRR
jgi:hypothetical protein